MDTQVLERRIVRIIEKIRDSRSRPCSQNILEFLNRGGEFTLDMETLRITFDGLMERSIIYNGGKGELESLYITKEVIDSSSVSNTEENLGVTAISNTHPDQDNNSSENTIGENSEYFKTQKFHNMVKNLIKDQVKHELSLLSVQNVSNNTNN